MIGKYRPLDFIRYSYLRHGILMCAYYAGDKTQNDLHIQTEHLVKRAKGHTRLTHYPGSRMLKYHVNKRKRIFYETKDIVTPKEMRRIWALGADRIVHEKWDSFTEWPLESTFQNYVLKRIKNDPEYADVKAFKVIKASELGISDLIMCVNGRFLAVELKVGNNHTTERQDLFIKQIIEAGGVAGEARTWRGVATLIQHARAKA